MNNNFKYSCIGDNTPENLNHLGLIGVTFIGISANDKILRVTNGSAITMSDKDYEVFQKCSFSNEHTNCINNPQLFRAVTAMKDDSDYMQWFKTDFENKLIPNVEGMYLCESREFCGITIKYKEEDFVIGSAGFHKATLEELINHFRKEVCPDNNPMKVFRKKA